MTVTASVDSAIRADPRAASSPATLHARTGGCAVGVRRQTPGYGPGASMADPLPAASPPGRTARGVPHREQSGTATPASAPRRRPWATALVVLGHFYQRDEVVQYADFVGDSFQLANAAQTRPEAEAIVFCGVHFMAETADMLSGPDQAVILPNLAAGCSMADMADVDSVEDCWEQLEELYGTEPDADGRVPVIPVTYMNSSAALKAFCGEHGGIVCTSSNAATVLEWAFERGQRVLFFPDQHLGRNTAKAMGVPLEQMPMWNPRKPLGGNAASRLCTTPGSFCGTASARCTSASPSPRSRRRAPSIPGVQRHRAPGVPDGGGGRRRRVRLHRLHHQGGRRSAAPGAVFAIGTEINMVQRLAAQYPEHTIFCLDPVVCPCSTMYRIHPGYLAWVLEGLVARRGAQPDHRARGGRRPARVALERMLAAKPRPDRWPPDHAPASSSSAAASPG